MAFRWGTAAVARRTAAPMLTPRAAQHALERRRVDLIRIDGQTAPEERTIQCSRFQENPRCRAAVLSVTAAGTGLTLTAASRVFFAELFWNPGALAQVRDWAASSRMEDFDCSWRVTIRRRRKTAAIASGRRRT